MRDEEQFSISDCIRAHVARTWGSYKSRELSIHQRLCAAHGEPGNGHCVRLPGAALATRDMTVAGVSGSSLLVGTSQAEYIPAIASFAAPIALGAQVVNAGRENIAVPRGASGATAHWLTDENTQIPESQPTVGMVGVKPKTIAALTEISHQALRQSNAEAVIRLELARAAGAALTAAILAGSSIAGQPQGIIGTTGVGIFTGTTLGLTGLRNAQEDIAPAIVNREAVGAITTPAIATTLAGRQRFTGSDRGVWEGASHEGLVEGIRGVTTTACPAATMIVGEWSQCIVVEWAGGVQLLVDPFTKFTQGLVGVRLLMLVDTYVQRPGAFTVSQSIT